MATPGPRIVPINELRFRPANSNDRARAGMEHAFNDVPPCSFAGDDGISPYMGARSGIDGYPDNPANHEALHVDVPHVAHDAGRPALALGSRLLRGGFGLSVFLHAMAAFAFGFASLDMPNDDALLEGETVIAVELFSETDSDVTTRARQVEQEGQDEAAEPPVEEPKVEPRQEITEPVQPEDEPEPVEQAKIPDPVAKPVEQPVIGVDQQEILSTTRPSEFQIEAAAKQIIDEVRIEPLPDTPPPMLVAPVEQAKIEPATKLANPLPHPISKPRVTRKAVVAKPVEKPVAREDEPEPKRTQPTRKTEVKKAEPKPQTTVRKKAAARDGNADADSNKGSSKADKKSGNSQDASQGNSKRKVKGNASTSNYKGLVQRKLERAKRRVRVAAKGTAVVSFTIAANGSVVNLRVRKSSGKPAIDKGALEIVRRASPFPAIPPDTGLKSYPVSVPMTFKGN